MTNIRIENFFWLIPEEIAARDQMSVNQLITKLYYESIDAEHDLENFTSFFLVCCARYLTLIGTGEISSSLDQKLTGIAAAGILERVQVYYNERRNLLMSAPHEH